MKKVIAIIAVVICLSSCEYVNDYDVAKLRVGMKYSKCKTILNDPLHIDKFDSDGFRVGKNYLAPSGYKRTLWMEFSQKDSILTNFYSI